MVGAHGGFFLVAHLRLPDEGIIANPGASCPGEVVTDVECVGGWVVDPENTNDRLCNRIATSQIVTIGLTHLYFAFAEIDPASFAIVVANDGDEDRYAQFNKLQTSSLKTWIAIGGFDISDPGSARTTW